MNIQLVWKILSIAWAAVSLYIGGLGLIIALWSTFHSGRASPELGGWRRILFNLLLVVSGIVAVDWAFDPLHFRQNLVQEAEAFASLSIFGVILYVLFKLLNRWSWGEAKFSSWMPRLFLPLRFAVAVGFLLGAVHEHDAIVRGLFLFAGGIQLLLVAWTLWLRWRDGNR